MANRVLVSDEGLKVSRPGFNVLTASEANLQFNSNWSHISFYMRGSVSLSASGTPHTIMFGKTFATRPLCFFNFEGRNQFVNDGAWWSLWSDDTVFPDYGASVRTDRMVITRYVAVNLRYIVWDLEL